MIVPAERNCSGSTATTAPASSPGGLPEEPPPDQRRRRHCEQAHDGLDRADRPLAAGQPQDRHEEHRVPGRPHVHGGRVFRRQAEAARLDQSAGRFEVAGCIRGPDGLGLSVRDPCGPADSDDNGGDDDGYGPPQHGASVGAHQADQPPSHADRCSAGLGGVQPIGVRYPRGIGGGRLCPNGWVASSHPLAARATSIVTTATGNATSRSLVTPATLDATATTTR
jgi:hypothetical protein